MQSKPHTQGTCMQRMGRAQSIVGVGSWQLMPVGVFSFAKCGTSAVYIRNMVYYAVRGPPLSQRIAEGEWLNCVPWGHGTAQPQGGNAIQARGLETRLPCAFAQRRFEGTTQGQATVTTHRRKQTPPLHFIFFPFFSVFFYTHIHFFYGHMGPDLPSSSRGWQHKLSELDVMTFVLEQDFVMLMVRQLQRTIQWSGMVYPGRLDT